MYAGNSLLSWKFSYLASYSFLFEIGMSACVFLISASLLIAVLSQPLLNTPLPTRVTTTFVSGGRDSRKSCPANNTLESARNNLTESFHINFETINTSQVISECGRGLWTQVLHFNMSNTSQKCLSPDWIETSIPVRSCYASTPTTCPGSIFSLSQLKYSRICGRALGYSSGILDAFALHGTIRSIDESYVDGISVTRGLPRRHVWSYAAGRGGNKSCPCDSTDRSVAPFPPSFVGNNYFCDGDYNGALWDAMECTTNCCTFNSPPWFSVSLPAPTSDDIEVRICFDGPCGTGRIQLNFLQLYVQ